MRYLLAVLLSLCFLPSVAQAQEQITASYQERANVQGEYTQAQLILCQMDPNHPRPDSSDDRGSLADTGEFCESGDWSDGFRAFGFTQIRMTFHEWDGGSADAKIWNCHLPTRPGSRGGQHANHWDPTTEAPDPAVAPVPSLTNNRECEELTDGHTFDGVTLTTITKGMGDDDEVVLGMIYGEIDDCTGECSSRLSVSIGP